MDHRQRHKRLRLLISKLNKERKNQAKKTDMLCNDLIAAQRDFIKRLSTISFAADFYKSIIGITDLGKLLSTAGKLIKDKIADANIAFFLHQAESYELYIFESDKPIAITNQPLPAEACLANVGQQLENCFTAELADNICKSNKPCTLDDMFAMGLQGNLMQLNKISAFAIPLSQLGPPLGFILICRSSENKLTTDDLNKVSAITYGLSRAIQSCQVLSHSGE